MGISNFIGNSYTPKYCYFIHKNRFYFQMELPGKFDKKLFKYNIFVKDKFYIIDINASKFIGSKDFFPKNSDPRKFNNNREEGPFHLRISVLAEDFQFKEKKIKLVKAPKKIDEPKKSVEKPISSKKGKGHVESEEPKVEKEKEGEIEPEEGVLTFYIELQETKDDEENVLPDSDED